MTDRGLTSVTALLGAAVAVALDVGGVHHGGVVVGAGVVGAEGLATLVDGAGVTGALGQPGLVDGGVAARATDGVAEQHLLPRLSRLYAVSATGVACIIRSCKVQGKNSVFVDCANFHVLHIPCVQRRASSA